MQVKVIGEYGWEQSLLGMGLSFGVTEPYGVEDFNQCVAPVAQLRERADKLARLDGGHNGFLEMNVVYLDITAPRYWSQQFNRYRIGVSRLSASTMHTIMKRHLNQSDFQSPIHQATLDHLNELIDANNFESVKNELPEGFLQRMVVMANYKALRNIIAQRRNHRLTEWQLFVDAVVIGVRHPEWL